MASQVSKIGTVTEDGYKKPLMVIVSRPNAFNPTFDDIIIKYFFKKATALRFCEKNKEYTVECDFEF